MQFGVFDHLDRDDQPLGDYYRARLQIIEAYDRLGFYAYHVAEHHATPLGMAPSPSELTYYGQDPDKSQKIYAEALELVIKGLTQRTLTFHGEFFHVEDVPMELEPLQKPHPPIWYGVHAPDSAARAARKGLRAVSLDPPGETCIAFDSFRAA